MHELADLLLGAACPGCGLAGLGLCPACRQVLRPCPRPVLDAPALAGLHVVSATPWEPCLGELLSAHKDRGALWLAAPLAASLTAAVARLLEGSPCPVTTVVVPVPSAPAQVRRRGYDHATTLARYVARRVPAPRPAGVVRTVRLLRRSRPVADQSGLGREARRANQQESLRAVRGPLPGAAVVLVDDVCTTGATLAEARRALLAAGWPVLGGAVVTHPPAPGTRCRQGP